MANRLDLQFLLEALLGSRNVYFQPPESVKINYPAIVYGLDDIQNVHADDGVYLSQRRYWIVLIDKNPDSEFVDRIVHLPTCRFDRQYPSENLNNWRFLLYY